MKFYSQHLFFPLGGDLGVVEGDGTGGVPRVGDDGVGVEGVAGSPLGGGEEGSNESSELATETSLSPSNCGMSAIAVMSLVGSLGGWRCRLRFAGGAGRDRLIVITAPLPAAPAAFFFAAARVPLAATAATLAVVAAAALGAAAVGATVAAEAATASQDIAAAL
jgi:hypothetical protein